MGDAGVSLVADSMSEVYDTGTLGEMDSATYWDWYHQIYGDTTDTSADRTVNPQ